MTRSRAARTLLCLAHSVWLVAGCGPNMLPAHDTLLGSPAGETVSDVYHRAEEAITRQGGIQHAAIQVEADLGFVAYTETIDQWVDPRRNVAREAAERSQFGRTTTLLTEHGHYVRETDGRFTTTPTRGWTCHGVGVAASAILGCPGPTERSTTAVQSGQHDGRPAVVVVTSGTLSGSDETFTFIRRLYLDPATYLPNAQETNGEMDFGHIKPAHERRIYTHEFLAPGAVPADFFDPGALGYAPQDPTEVLNQPPAGLSVYWLGLEVGGAGDLPPLVLAKVDAHGPRGPGYRLVLNYARADEPFAPPVATLQLWPRAAWDAFLAQSRGMSYWEDPCWSRREVALSDGRATLLLGFGRDMVRLHMPSAIPEAAACPARPHDTFLAHAYLGQSVILVAMPGVTGLTGTVKSPYDTRPGLEALVRALRRYSPSGAVLLTPTPTHP